MKNKIKLAHPEDDIDDPVVNCGLGHQEANNDIFLNLSNEFRKLNVEVNLECLEKEYYSNSFIGKCLMWKKLKGERKVS